MTLNTDRPKQFIQTQRKPMQMTHEGLLDATTRRQLKEEIVDLQEALVARYQQLQEVRTGDYSTTYTSSFHLPPLYKVFIETLIGMGWYDSVSDFLRQAVRTQLLTHGFTMNIEEKSK